MHKPRKDRWYNHGVTTRTVDKREFKGTPQFTLDELFITPFTEKKNFDPETGAPVWVPLERNFKPTGIHVFDEFIEWIATGHNQLTEFYRRYGLRSSDIDALCFVLTGMGGTDFRLTYQMRIADMLLRYTSLEMKDVARISGLGSAVNLYQSYVREYNYAPGYRRYMLRESGDEGRYRL